MTIRRSFRSVLAAAVAATAALALAALGGAPSVRADISPSISLTSSGTPYNQNFDTLPSVSPSPSPLPTATPAGWGFSETGTAANTTYNVGTGSSATGDTYDFGATSSTERAFGGLQSGALTPTIGASFTNNTGSTITSLAISYTGEQWRLGTTNRGVPPGSTPIPDRIDFQYSLNATSLGTGTWTDVDALDFTSPITTGPVGALDGNAAANHTALSSSITGLSIPNGATFFIRWSSVDVTGADDGLAVDDFSLTPTAAGGGGVTISVANQTIAEGNSFEQTMTFSVVLSGPAPAGGVDFDIATSDGTAHAGTDYQSNGYPASIPEGSSGPVLFEVTVNGDTDVEPDETFSVDVTNVTGATPTSLHATGTIQNDDVSITPIAQVQGSGSTSPITGTSVTVEGIVTGVKSNAFFLQDPTGDGNPATSEGILVFTGTPLPSGAVVGNQVRVSGTVIEFVPGSDTASPPITEIGGTVTVSALSTGNPLPTPVTLTAADTDPNGGLDVLERFESMRVHVDTLSVIAPTSGTVDEVHATSSSAGFFYGVVGCQPTPPAVTCIPPVARPFREPGLQLPNPLPSGAPSNIPRFDANPERLEVSTVRLTGGAALDVATGQTVTNITGPLEYAFRVYIIDQDPGTVPGVTGTVAVTPVPVPAADEYTVASFNMQRFFDTVNDPESDAVLTTDAFDMRLAKASLAIRNVLRVPDTIGVEEMEHLSTLQAVANKVNTDAGNPAAVDYHPYLEEGNDVGGIDVGFLVNHARVSVVDVTQEGKDVEYINPNNGQPELLNDRPSLVLRAGIKRTGLPDQPVTVIVNHLRSLSSVEDPTDGNRVRTKRRAQAEWLANYVQGRQIADPTERIVLVGDFNAFPFNDGLVDSMGTIMGTPTPPDQVVLASSDLVNPNLIDVAASVPPDVRYSYTFDGNAQELDHVLATPTLSSALRGIDWGRMDSDFPEILRGDATTPARFSDHDPAVARFRVDGNSANVRLIPSSPAPVVAGSDVTFTYVVANDGPDTATGVQFQATLPPGLAFSSATTDRGSCTGATCLIGTLTVGLQANVTVVAGTDAYGTYTNNAAVTAEQSDPVPANNVRNTKATVIDVTQVKVSASSATGGCASSPTGTIVLSGKAPAGGVAVSLSSSAGASVPPTVTVPENATSATFAVATASVDTTTAVTLTATLHGSASRTLTVKPNGVASLVLGSTTLAGGASTSASATLTCASTVDETVSFTTSSPSTTSFDDATIVVPAGSTTAETTFNTTPVHSSRTVTVAARAHGIGKTVKVTITP